MYLKNLLSDNEYKEICNYLNTPADKDGNYYLLICKKFYGSAKYGYVPSQLEIVKSNKEMTGMFRTSQSKSTALT